jgi:hypothetical protein
VIARAGGGVSRRTQTSSRNTARYQDSHNRRRSVYRVGIHDLTGSDRIPLVAQAITKGSAQVDCPVDDALYLMNALAQSSRQSLEQTAVAVVERRVRFAE